jgi:hypothetical protein
LSCNLKISLKSPLRSTFSKGFSIRKSSEVKQTPQILLFRKKYEKIRTRTGSSKAHWGRVGGFITEIYFANLHLR